MIPHPSRIVASAEEHRQDLLALAARERLATAVAAETPRAPIRPQLWGLVAHSLRMMRSWLSVQLRPRVWTHA